MTVPVPDQLEYISDADGVTKDFSYSKRFLQKDEIVVLLRDADGVDTPQILNTHYTIAGSSWPSGGTISFMTAPLAPNKVVRYRMTQAKQTVDLENNQRNDAPSVETQLDRLTMAIQDRGRLSDAAWRGLLAEVAARVHGDKLLNGRIDQEIIDRIAGDEALASLIGNVGSGNAPLFDTRLAVSLANIDPIVNALRTAGYTSVGDGGAALYKRVTTQPAHAGRIQSADGAWWEISEPILNVKMFGAKGDGITDDTIAIQAAINFLPSSSDDPNYYDRGGALFVPTGTYVLSNELVVNKNISLVGIGNVRFTGNVSASTHKCGIFVGDNSYLTNTSAGYFRVLISNLNLAGISGHECSIRSYGLRTIIIERCTVSGGSVGSIEIIAAWSASKVRDCWFQGGGNSGLRILDASNAFEISGNRFAGYRWDGATGLSLFIRGSMGVWIRNNDFEYSHRHIYVQSTVAGPCNNLVIENNWIEGAEDGSIFLDNDVAGFKALTIKGNSIWGDPNGDVYLGSTAGTGAFIGGVIMGNTFNAPTFLYRRSNSTLYKAIVQSGNYPEGVNP